jgi:hypothetical protein
MHFYDTISNVGASEQTGKDAHQFFSGLGLEDYGKEVQPLFTPLAGRLQAGFFVSRGKSTWEQGVCFW